MMVLQIWGWNRFSHLLNGFLSFQVPWNCSSLLFSSCLNRKDTKSITNYLYESVLSSLTIFLEKHFKRICLAREDDKMANLGGTGEVTGPVPTCSRHSLYSLTDGQMAIQNDKINHFKENGEVFYIGFHNPFHLIFYHCLPDTENTKWKQTRIPCLKNLYLYNRKKTFFFIALIFILYSVGA